MPGVAKLMEIILKYFIHIPFIGNSVDFVIGGYKAGKEFFSVELCMECTDLLVFLYWCRELIRKLRFPCDRFCFFQKISFLTIFFRKYCVYFQHNLFGRISGTIGLLRIWIFFSRCCFCYRDLRQLWKLRQHHILIIFPAIGKYRSIYNFYFRAIRIPEEPR